MGNNSKEYKDMLEYASALEKVTNRLLELEQQRNAVNKSSVKNIERLRDIEDEIQDLEKAKAEINSKSEKRNKDAKKKYEDLLAVNKQLISQEIEKLELLEAQGKEITDLDKKHLEELREEQKLIKEKNKDLKEQTSLIEKISEGYHKASEAYSKLANIAGKVGSVVGAGITAFGGKADLESYVTSGMEFYRQNAAKVSARLQTASNNGMGILGNLYGYYGDISKEPYVNMSNIASSLVNIASQGISFNVEERAFIASLKDDMVASFDALDSNLQRTIRLNQEDLTKAYLGNEAELLQLLNETFLDSTYLNSVYDSVTNAMFDTMASMTSSESTEFLYNVQKWLGAMYEVGVSESTLTSVASAINALGTGDAEALTSSPIGVLLEMAIERSNSNLANILTGGLDADTVNDVMYSLVELLQDIKENTSTQTTLSAYAKVLGVTTSDLRAATTLSDAVLSTLIGSIVTKEAAENEALAQIGGAMARQPESGYVENMLTNLLFGAGYKVAQDPQGYLTTRVGSLIEQIGSNIGGIGGGIVSLLGAGAKWGTYLGALSPNAGLDGTSLGLDVSGIGAFIKSIGTSADNLIKGLSVASDYFVNTFNAFAGGREFTVGDIRNLLGSSAYSSTGLLYNPALSSTAGVSTSVSKSTILSDIISTSIDEGIKKYGISNVGDAVVEAIAEDIYDTQGLSEQYGTQSLSNVASVEGDESNIGDFAQFAKALLWNYKHPPIEVKVVEFGDFVEGLRDGLNGIEVDVIDSDIASITSAVSAIRNA